jgi:hypothetical protein
MQAYTSNVISLVTPIGEVASKPAAHHSDWGLCVAWWSYYKSVSLGTRRVFVSLVGLWCRCGLMGVCMAAGPAVVSASVAHFLLDGCFVSSINKYSDTWAAGFYAR